LRNVVAAFGKDQQFGGQIFLMWHAGQSAKPIRLLPELRRTFLHGRDASPKPLPHPGDHATFSRMRAGRGLHFREPITGDLQLRIIERN
jgi:hypothetical protein